MHSFLKGMEALRNIFVMLKIDKLNRTFELSSYHCYRRWHLSGFLFVKMVHLHFVFLLQENCYCSMLESVCN